MTRDALLRFASWPQPDEDDDLGWIGHEDGPANRIIAPGDVLQVMLWSSEENSLLTNRATGPPGSRR
ncbi:hypothetical protein Rumeso_01451 [Rubellimicrobium mesophilum DSM 19309]|uniref:Uncharacterized protein n=1 Tax=Rubellimicrobium mesophilum DSM 19309 TaxID=442562 RepID=A0A017HT44_9RHOB|nr:hypothetical protein [Rubellimicrobium mesophilum]EYD76929.1 hypothetical protein Rumeso_01451 [Rubellimicrobium mesophilum DSM 19309]